jgi:hypothetical protein
MHGTSIVCWVCPVYADLRCIRFVESSTQTGQQRETGAGVERTGVTYALQRDEDALELNVRVTLRGVV